MLADVRGHRCREQSALATAGQAPHSDIGARPGLDAAERDVSLHARYTQSSCHARGSDEGTTNPVAALIKAPTPVPFLTLPRVRERTTPSTRQRSGCCTRISPHTHTQTHLYTYIYTGGLATYVYIHTFTYRHTRWTRPSDLTELRTRGQALQPETFQAQRI